jgi:hypothetical protein
VCLRRKHCPRSYTSIALLSSSCVAVRAHQFGRVDRVRSSAKAGSGHPASSLSAADLMTVLLARTCGPAWLRGRLSRPPGRVGQVVLNLRHA